MLLWQADCQPWNAPLSAEYQLIAIHIPWLSQLNPARLPARTPHCPAGSAADYQSTGNGSWQVRLSCDSIFFFLQRSCNFRILILSLKRYTWGGGGDCEKPVDWVCICTRKWRISGAVMLPCSIPSIPRPSRNEKQWQCNTLANMWNCPDRDKY